MSTTHYRNSKQRSRVLEAVQNSGTHPTAEYIFDTLRKEEHVDQTARNMGCKVTAHRLILDGLCPQCAKMDLDS